MSFTVKLADKIIQIENIYPQLENLCKDYLVEDAKPDFSVSWSLEDIAAERQAGVLNTFTQPYLETLVALRKISEQFPHMQRFLMHGASIAYKGKAYLFTAPSGTGKSTHIRLWKKYLGDEVKIVNGDKPFISLEDSAPIIYGTPWAGKEHWQRNCSEILHGICFVQRGSLNSIRRMDATEALPLLMRQVFIPSEPLAAGLTLELIDSLLKVVPLYLLTCDMSEDAVRCSFEGLTGLTYPN